VTKQRRPRRSWGKILRMRSGRYQAGYNGPDLARHYAPTTFTSKMDAEHWLADERRLIERGEWTPPKLRSAANKARGKAFGEYATGWLEQRNLKPRTRQGYSELIDGPLAKLAKVPLALITPQLVRTWHVGLGTSTPTKNRHTYGLLHAVLNTAVTGARQTDVPAPRRCAVPRRVWAVCSHRTVSACPGAQPDIPTMVVGCDTGTGCHYSDCAPTKTNQRKGNPMADTRIRMRISVAGQFHGIRDVKRGQVVEVPESEAKRYMHLGYAQPVHLKELGPPYIPVDPDAP